MRSLLSAVLVLSFFSLIGCQRHPNPLASPGALSGTDPQADQQTVQLTIGSPADVQAQVLSFSCYALMINTNQALNDGDVTDGPHCGLSTSPNNTFFAVTQVNGPFNLNETLTLTLPANTQLTFHVVGISSSGACNATDFASDFFTSSPFRILADFNTTLQAGNNSLQLSVTQSSGDLVFNCQNVSGVTGS